MKISCHQSRWWRNLGKAFDWFESILVACGGLLCVLLVLIISYDVVARYFFNSPTSWVLDISGYMLIYVLFLGAGWLLKEDGHVSIDIVVKLISPKPRKIVIFIAYIICSLACLLLIWNGWALAWDAYSNAIPLWRGILVPKHILYWPVPFGGLLLLVECLRKAKECLGKEDKEAKR